MGAVYFISKSKGAVDPKRLTTTVILHCGAKINHCSEKVKFRILFKSQ